MVLFVLDDIYGWLLVDIFKIEVKKFGICLVFDILILYNFFMGVIRKLVSKFCWDKNIEIILFFIFEGEVVDFFCEVIL